MTVGTNPAVCATTTSVVFPPGGGNVTYCYSVRNTGNITLTRHTLVDNRLGSVLSNFPYALAPGASTFVTQTALVTNPQVSTATWTASNPGPVDTAIGTDSVTVIVSPPSPAIVLDMTAGTNPAACATTTSILLPPGGGNVTYCYTARNTGNVTFTRHSLVDNRLGTLLSNFPYALAPGASAFITQTAVITGSSVSMATWTAFNPGPVDTAVGTDSVTVTVSSLTPAIVLEKTVGTNPGVCSATDNILLPFGGGDATYCYSVRNTGSVTLTRHTLVDNKLGTVLSSFQYTLAPGASAFVTQTATIAVDTVNSATWTAYNPGPVNTVAAIDVAEVRVTKRVHLPLMLRP